MTLTIIHKLLMLTNGDIIETSGEDAYIKRQSLVRQVFYGLSERDQNGIFEVTEFADVMRTLRRHCGSKFNDEALRVFAHSAIDHMKKEHLKNSAGAPRSKPQPPEDDADWEPF